MLTIHLWDDFFWYEINWRRIFFIQGFLNEGIHFPTDFYEKSILKLRSVPINPTSLNQEEFYL